MNTRQSYRQQLLLLLSRIDDTDVMNTALEAVLTAKELEEIENRLQIFQMLAEHTPQREIAASLGVGIATVTRGARAFRQGKFAALEPHLSDQTGGRMP